MLGELLFPRSCLSCHREGHYLCRSCRQKIKRLGQICPVCQRPTFLGKTHGRCRTRFSLDGLISLFPYQGIIKTAIGQLKYQLVTDLRDELASLAASAWPLVLVKDNAFTLTPVPLHPRRQRWRGFNQAEVLGQLLAKKLHWSFTNQLLVRTRYTQPQVDLKGKDRKKNVSFAFKPKRKSVLFPPRVIIFDDVWTTGSTLKECGRVLKKGGSQEVWGMTLAR